MPSINFAHVLLEHERLVGETVVRELRSKLRIKLKLSRNAIDEIEALLRDQTVVKTPTEHLSLVISDPDDKGKDCETAEAYEKKSLSRDHSCHLTFR